MKHRIKAIPKKSPPPPVNPDAWRMNPMYRDVIIVVAHEIYTRKPS